VPSLLLTNGRKKNSTNLNVLQKGQDPHLRCDNVLSPVQCVLKSVSSDKSNIFQIIIHSSILSILFPLNIMQKTSNVKMRESHRNG